ncbi:hypothetical protein BJ878DRAFT_263337 [Calycina marina]|uniref:Uncharacterized protein n=1 Tax=Calycina marina TaxID=1763456 RepID=A0A9P7Z6W8_9HELO|nr:hypothetical protein BJ878DRAFT_263337 [Calycina marina]
MVACLDAYNFIPHLVATPICWRFMVIFAVLYGNAFDRALTAYECFIRFAEHGTKANEAEGQLCDLEILKNIRCRARERKKRRLKAMFLAMEVAMRTTRKPFVQTMISLKVIKRRKTTRPMTTTWLFFWLESELTRMEIQSAKSKWQGTTSSLPSVDFDFARPS